MSSGSNSSHDQAAQAVKQASWVATTIARVALRFSGYPGRKVVGAWHRRKGREQGGQPFTVPCDDGVELAGWFSPATAQPRGMPIVLLHGWIEVKEFHMHRARRLNQAGHDVILYDHRAHGQSTGRHTTFGVREREDLAAVLNEAQRQGLIGSRVITMGFSMGAATVLQHAPTDDRVEAVVSFAPFSDLREAIMSFRLKLAPWVDHEWLMRGFDRATAEAAFSIDEASTYEAIRRIDRPVLLIEAGRDTNLPPNWHTQKLLAEAPGADIRLVTIDDATHCGLCRRTWPGLDEKILAFCREISHKNQPRHVEPRP